MIVNVEQNMTAIGRKADELPKLRTQLRADARDALPPTRSSPKSWA